MDSRVRALLDVSGVFWSTKLTAIRDRIGYKVSLPATEGIMFYASPLCNPDVLAEAIWVNPKFEENIVDFCILHELGHATIKYVKRSFDPTLYVSVEESIANAIATEWCNFLSISFNHPRLTNGPLFWNPIRNAPKQDVIDAMHFMTNTWWSKIEKKAA